MEVKFEDFCHVETFADSYDSIETGGFNIWKETTIPWKTSLMPM